MDRIVKRVAIVVFLPVLLCVAACGGEDEQDRAGARAGPSDAALSTDDVEALSLLSPLTRALREALAGTNRICVRAGGDSYEPEGLDLLYEVKGADAAHDMIRRIEVDETPEECSCSGQLTFQFYRGNSLKALVIYYHGVRLGWSKGTWGSSLRLTPESQKLVLEWLVDKGIDEKRLRLSPSLAQPESGRQSPR